MPPPPNRAPVAILTGPTTARVGQRAVFDGSASFDPDHPQLSSWRFSISTLGVLAEGKGQPWATLEWVPEPGDVGTVDALLEVTDKKGITVQSFPIAVDVAEAVEPLTVTCPEPVTVEAVDPDGVVADYPDPVVEGGVPPVTLVTTPASGSLFPVGTTVVDVVARDAEANMVQCSFPVTVIPAALPLTITTATLATAVKDQPYSQPIVATGGTVPYTFAITSGTLPAGLSLNAGTGLISGTPTVTATAALTIRVTDAAARQTTRSYTLFVTEIIPPGSGTHDYFDMLMARADRFAGYSLRTDAQVQSLVAGNTGNDYAYLYPGGDPDPRRQDAMRIRIRQGEMSPDGILSAPIGPSSGANFFFTYDFWMGAEWDFHHALIQGHKNYAPVSFRIQGFNFTWFGSNTNYRDIYQHPQNLPPGGPYVALIFPHVNVAGRVKHPFWWRDGETGFPRATLPYTAPADERRTYTEAIQLFDTSVYAPGVEFGLVPERWHRVWHYFERTPGEDYVSDHPATLGQAHAAYKWTMWFADPVRAATRIMNEALIGLPLTSPQAFRVAMMGFGSGAANEPAKDVIRDDLVAYSRNWVALHGTSKAEVLALLQQPVP